MPYRLMLEVPAALGEEARSVVDQAPEAEVIGERGAEPSGEGAAALTIVAHSLGVVDALYQWLADQPAAAPARLGPLGGPLVPMAEVDAPAMRARLAEIEQGPALGAGTGSAAAGVPPSVVAETVPTSLEPYGLTVQAGGPLIEVEQTLVFEGIDHIAIRVAIMRRAEEFYRGFFQMNVELRARRQGETWQTLPADYDWDAGVRGGVFADLVYLTHPPLRLALLEAGRGAIFQEPRLGHISLRVAPATLATLRAEALIRSLPTMRDQPHSFIFQDPFGITWHLTDRPSL
ncbi:MAG TPA: VOC family protein [Thermomicrobiaceae bacterium]|nr:VOC family protein [Thermomicrobiaceae bacterium]